MNEFKSFMDTIERLIALDGCPWNREQTLQSLRPLLIEETYEVIEAIDLDHDVQIEEEIGDLLFNVIFLCKLAEKEQRFNLQGVLKRITEKLVRRHPHIFGKAKADTTEAVLKQWEEIKKTEKKEQIRSALDGIPKDLPTLARAQKVAKKLAYQHFIAHHPPGNLSAEEQAGEILWNDVQQIAQQEIQAEHALRKRLTQVETEFREWEQNNMNTLT